MPEASGTPETNILLWLVPLFPLIGYLIIAFFGRGLTGAPLPVVKSGGGHDAHGHAGGGRDVDAGQATPTAHKDTSDGPAFDAHGHDVAADAGHAAAVAHDDDHGHGGHGEAHLSPGGTKRVGGLATVMVLLSFAVSVLLFLSLLGGGGGEERRIFSPSFEWMHVPAMAGLPSLDLRFQLAVDPLTALMLLIITGIGTLIHLYSTGYMSHDGGYARYFGYLNLFVFFMLLLVMGANFLVTFVGWEGVGLASYLLIGFWYTRQSATDAGKKAFIVNRVGDFAMLVALFLIFKFFGTFDYFGENGVLTRAAAHNLPAGYLQAGLFLGAGAVTLIPLLMFAGATGKSAQIPLYVWLPDAMEGPTPVSALIHAATMVTAGVYMVCRAHSLFVLSPLTMTIVAVIGLTTAFLAATIGLVQNDIKKVLAYSTVSQLGLMFLAAGVGAFGIAMFHVTTHAFFKALLFLGSGSVIHAMSGEQDMRKMGGLGLKIKTTWATMLIGTLAIAGIPLLSGFFSKDEILLNAFAGPGANGLGSPLLWAGGFAVSGMTAFYMVRMMMKTFAGQPRFSPEVGSNVHESPVSMTFPLQVLAVLSLLGGFLNPAALGALGIHAPHYLEHFLGETVGWRERANLPLNVEHGQELLLVLLSSLLAVGVCFVARRMYLRAARGERMTEQQKQSSGLWRTLYNKYGVDEVYNGVFVRGGKAVSNFLWQFIDVRVVDGLVNGIAGGIGVLSNRMRGLQNGYVRSYALTMLLGVVVVILGCLIGLGTLGAARP